jgi:hypothetical protein
MAEHTRSSRQFFEPHEDKLLRQLVDQLGTDDWRRVAALMPSRTPRQCRERYNAYLCPTINTAPWSPAEDAVLLAKFPHYGSRWAGYRPFFKRRTLASIRNRWYVLMRKQEQLRQPQQQQQRWSGSLAPAQEEREKDPLAVFDIANLLNPTCMCYLASVSQQGQEKR